MSYWRPVRRCGGCGEVRGSSSVVRYRTNEEIDQTIDTLGEVLLT